MKPTKAFSCFLTAIILLAPQARPAIADTTNLELINGTGKYVYVDVFQGIALQHVGLFAPGQIIKIWRGVAKTQFFLHVHVYVKSHQTEDASATICHTTKDFGNTSKEDVVGPKIVEHIRFENGNCFIR